MENTEVEKAKAFVINDLLDYDNGAVSCKNILKKVTGGVILFSFDSEDDLTAKVSPFDTFIQVIEGTAEIVIDGRSSILVSGEGIVIPAHSQNTLKGDMRFKMLSTVIKNGYEDLI